MTIEEGIKRGLIDGNESCVGCFYNLPQQARCTYKAEHSCARLAEAVARQEPRLFEQ